MSHVYTDHYDLGPGDATLLAVAAPGFVWPPSYAVRDAELVGRGFEFRRELFEQWWLAVVAGRPVGWRSAYMFPRRLGGDMVPMGHPRYGFRWGHDWRGGPCRRVLVGLPAAAHVVLAAAALGDLAPEELVAAATLALAGDQARWSGERSG